MRLYKITNNNTIEFISKQVNDHAGDLFCFILYFNAIMFALYCGDIFLKVKLH